MHFFIDAREACRERRTGKGAWAYGFLRELLRREVPVTLLTDSSLPLGLAGPVKCFPSGFLWHLYVALFLRSHSQQGDIVYVSPTSFVVPVLLPCRVRGVPIVHDLIAYAEWPHPLKARIIERSLLPRALHRAWRVCTVSEVTRSAVLQRWPWLHGSRVAMISSGPTVAGPLHSLPDNRTILCSGTLCPRKNQLRLIQAYALLPEGLRHRYRLLLVGGRGWGDRPILRAVERTEGVQWVGYASPEDYVRMLCSCHVFAFPSLDEGFGMPVLDALCAGVPVLISSRGALPEVVGTAACPVDPEDVSALRDGLIRILTDDVLRRDLRHRALQRARQFSWQRTVDLFLAAVGS